MTAAEEATPATAMKAGTEIKLLKIETVATSLEPAT